MSNSKCVYYKEKEQKSIDGGITWVDTGNFRKGALISTQASQCGSFVTEYRWTKADYVCDNANKYKGYKQQVSHDNGGSWVDTGVVDIGSLIESNSRDCGYDEQWFVLTGDNDFICDEGSKYKKKEMKYTRDSGTTWNSFNPPKYEKGDLIESNSKDCQILSMKVTYTDGSEKKFYGLSSIEKNTDANKSNAKKVEIYDGVTSIGNEAFYNSKLTDITIPNSVTSIGPGAFWGCMSLTGITIPSSVAIIGAYAFHECSNLQSINIPDGIISIFEGVFFDCLSLTSITIPISVKEIGDYAFRHCSSLTGISLPYYLEKIGVAVFHECKSLKNITIQANVESIDGFAFAECPHLTTITVRAITPPSLGTDAFTNSGIQTIYVPASSVNAYKSADEWKNYASKIQAIPE